MPTAPEPSKIFHRAAEEGERRLDQSMLELASGSFIAGFTIVFGVIALGITHALVEPQLGEGASIAGALAFPIGLVFLIVGRTELFTENFSDPIAAVFREKTSGMPRRILRLWSVTLVLNLVGGLLFALLFSVHGILPEGASHALSGIAEDLAARGTWTGFVSALIGGALVALLSFLCQATKSTGSRIAMAYFVGFLLALGPFDHVVVTVLHVFFGILFGAAVGYETFFSVLGVATAGNLVGGVGLVALSHVAQAKGADADGGSEDGKFDDES